MSEPTAADLVPFLRDRRLTVFAGAGVSVLPPSCLPGWWQLNHAVLDALAEASAPVLPDAGEIIDAVLKRQADGKLPPEYTSEVIAGSIAEDYFEVLRNLEGIRPNHVHRWLALLGKAGRLPAIVTTNFDTLTERAFDQIGARLDVLVFPAEYRDIDLAARLADPNAPTLLLKLHGTATEPATCIDTLAQRKKGFPEPIAVLLRELIAATRICVLGYSGADLEAEPNYLFLRQMAARPHAPGFDWLYLPDSVVPPAVESLADVWGERARIHRGTLPGWMDPWGPVLDENGLKAPPPWREESESSTARRSNAQLQLTVSAREWATGLGPFAPAAVVGQLASAAAPEREVKVHEQVLAWTTANEPDSRHEGVAALALGRSYHRAGRIRESLEVYQRAIGLFRDLQQVDAFSDGLNEWANLLSGVGQFDDAAEAYRESARIAQASGDPEGTVIPMINLAHTLAMRGRIDEAREAGTDGVDRAIAVGDESARALALEHLGLMLRETGDPDAALEKLRDAEAVRRRLGQDAALAFNLNTQASIHSGRAEFDRATELLDEAVALADRLGQLRLKAATLTNHAGLHQMQGNVPAAEALLREAMDLRDKLGDRYGRLEAIVSLIGMMATHGRAMEAVAQGEAAIAQARELGVPSTLADLHANTGLAYEQKGELEQARQHYEAARSSAAMIGYRQIELSAVGNLANLAYRQGQLDQAETAYRQASDIAREIDDVAGVVRSLANVGNVQVQREQFEPALATYSEALELADANGLEGICGPLWLNLGSLQWRLEHLRPAADSFRRAHILQEAAGDRPTAGQAQYYLGCVLIRAGDRDGGKAALEQALALWEGMEHPHAGQVQQMLQQLG